LTKLSMLIIPIPPSLTFKFLSNNIFKINDIWGKNNNTLVDNQTIFNRLDDKRNWISSSLLNIVWLSTKVLLIISYFVYKFYLLTFDKIVYVNHSHPPFINI
jgi:hypothetical protein